MYKASQDAGAQSAPQGDASQQAGNPADEVTDVDFEEVKDDDEK